MENEGSNTNEKYILLVDSHNSARTFGVARNKETVEHNKFILELPSLDFILNEIGGIDNTLQFSFGRYIVLYFIDTETLFFIDYSLIADQSILQLILQRKVSTTFLENFFSIQFRLETTFKPEEDILVDMKLISEN